MDDEWTGLAISSTARPISLASWHTRVERPSPLLAPRPESSQATCNCNHLQAPVSRPVRQSHSTDTVGYRRRSVAYHWPLYVPPNGGAEAKCKPSLAWARPLPGRQLT